MNPNLILLACAGLLFASHPASAGSAGNPDQPITKDSPAVVRDFSGGASADRTMTIDFYVYGSDGLCVPASVCGGGLGVTYKLPGEDKERHCGVKEDGTYQGRTFQYVLNPVNLLDTVESARGFQPGEDYDPDPNVTRPATRLANRLLINPESLFKRFMDTFEAVEGVRPIPVDISTGLEVYPRGPGAVKKHIINHVTDTRYYSRGSSPHVKVLLYKDGKAVMPYGSHVALSCMMWRRTEHTDFAAGEVLDLMGNRLPASGFAAWGWQNGYGGLQYGDYVPGMGMYFVPALAFGESWDFRYNGNIHIRTNYQQDPPCWTKAVVSNSYIYPGKAYASEFAPVVFGRVEPRLTTDPDRPTQQVRVFDDPSTSYAPQDAFNYEDDKLAVMKWERGGKRTAQIVRGRHFLQGGASMLFPGKDVPNSLRKVIASEGLKGVTLTTHWFHLPGEGYDSSGAFLAIEFANAPKLTLTATKNGTLSISRPGEKPVQTSLKLKQAWNAVQIVYGEDSQFVYVRLGKEFAAADGKRLTFPAGGGLTALEIGKAGARSERGNVLFDAIWINPNDKLAENFEYASLGEMRDTWKGDGEALSLDAQISYSGKQSLKLPSSEKPAAITRTLDRQSLRGQTVQLAWYMEAKGGGDSFAELRSADGKSFLRLRGDEEGKLLYQTEKGDWVPTNTKFRPEFLEKWNELAVLFDSEGNAYLRFNMDWVAQADGSPLVIPKREALSELSIGRTGAAGGTAVYFDDLRLIRNYTLIADATLYSATFEYPLDPKACIEQLGWANLDAAGASLETGKGATGGQRYLVLPNNAPAEVSVTRTFPTEMQDVTTEFSWFHDPEAGKRADAGYVQLVDAKGNKLALSVDGEGKARYKINELEWKATDYKLVKGWNKTRVVFPENKPAEFWMAPQRPGCHPKGQWMLIAQDTYTTRKLKTDFKQNIEQIFSGLKRIEVGRNKSAEGAFLFDDVFVLTNKPSKRDVMQPDFGNNRMTFANEVDNRLANRDWPQIEKVLMEKNLLKKQNDKADPAPVKKPSTAVPPLAPNCTAIDVLRNGVLSHEPNLQASGEMFDSIYGESAQYGTPYHAYSQAVLALRSTGEERERHFANAYRGLDAALTHVADPELKPNLSGITRAVGTCNFVNHRDFFWSAILKTYRILKQAGYPGMDSMATRISAIRVPSPFLSAPPGNWSAFWLNGEWIRMKEGLSDTSRERFDQWLGEFFKLLCQVDRGFYAEPGLPNSYDLFTRYQLAEILAEGYDGPWRESLQKLLVNGLRRSLNVQLSDGSQGSAYRSTAQSWTVSNEICFFTLAADYFRKSDPALTAAAEKASRLALASFIRWFPKDRPYSAVENLLPPEWRVGFETYSLEGCYANMALGFLANAVERGFSGTPLTDASDRKPAVFVENDPVYRAFTHYGRYSAQVNAWPAQGYDAFGLVDLSFGPGRYLQAVSSVKHLQENKLFNIGMALRKLPGRSDIRVIGQQDLRLDGPIESIPGRNGISLRARAHGDVTDLVARDAWLYRLSVTTDKEGIHVEESTPGLNGYKTLLIPYLLDAGTGSRTRVSVEKEGKETKILLTLGKEQIVIRIAATMDKWLDIPYGFENRRGLCGLLRIDLVEPTETIRYSLAVDQ